MFILFSFFIGCLLFVACKKTPANLKYDEARKIYGDDAIMIKASEGVCGNIAFEDNDLLNTVYDVTFNGHVKSSCSYPGKPREKQVEYDLSSEDTERLYELSKKLNCKKIPSNYGGYAWNIGLNNTSIFCYCPLPTTNKKIIEARSILLNGRLEACEIAGIEEDERNYQMP